MADQSESVPAKGKGKSDEPVADGRAQEHTTSTVESDDESGDEDAEHETQDGAEGSSGAPATSGDGSKKKKRKRSKKLKQILGSGQDKAEGKDSMDALGSLTPDQLADFVKLNPALAYEVAARTAPRDASGASTETLQDLLKRLKLQDVLTGLATSGKNRKDMASYKFWNTQPVPQFGEDAKVDFEEGPLKVQTVDEIPAEPVSLVLDQFEWETMDLTQDAQMEEVYKLLNGHYVEDDEAMFRFKYSTSILRWALMSPGWKKQWHVGIRSGKTLCAFISAIPLQLRVRDKVINASEVNFLCVHKKLRNKRLAPVLIKEITRLCNREGVFQAIYTGGIVLPRPVSTCRYYHRAINWQKLYEAGFSPCPSNSKPAMQVRKFALPEHTTTKGLRAMKADDVDAVHHLLTKYLKRFDMAQVFTKEEVEHWLLHKKDVPGDQVIWSYVVEDSNKNITDFVSFYCLESSIINNAKHSVIKAAYLFYYATETAFEKPNDKAALKKRLNALVHDALVLAKQHGFDVFNALSLLENGLILEEQKFGPGDGQLHYYLFNYRAHPIAGGVDKDNKLDADNLSGLGFVAL